MLTIYSDTGSRVLYTTSPAYTTFSVTVTPGNNQTHTYTAYISQDAPSPGPPVVDVRSQSAVTISDAGWIGSVTLTSDRTQTDANNPSAQLTVTLDRPLAGPYALTVYSDTGARLLYTTSPAYTMFTVTVTPGNNQAVTYTAYVSQDAPSAGPPVVDVRSPSSVTIEDQGWIGSLQLTSNVDAVTQNNPTATLTETLDRSLAGPYVLTVYSDTGSRLLYTTSPAYTTFSVTVTPGTDQTHTYTAYVSQDAPSVGPPQVDVRAIASITYTNGVLTAETMQRIDLNYLASLLVSETDDEVALELCDSPEATYFEESTVCDEALAYLAAINAGKSRARALAAAIGKAVGPAAAAGLGAYLILHHTTPPAPPQAVPQTPPPPPPDVSDPPPPELIIASPTHVQYLAQVYLDRAARAGRELSPDAAQAGANQCDTLVTWAIQSGVGIPAASGDPCADLPIFFPGSNPPGQTSPTTQHDWDAITGSSGVDHWSPTWIQLNWVNQFDRTTSGLNLGWYNPAYCVATAPNHCDEYPYFSSAQSGPASFVGPPGASLRVVNGSDNSSQGSRYRWFGTKCGLTSGGQDKTTAAEQGSPFLVIPMPSPHAPPTFYVCGP